MHPIHSAAVCCTLGDALFKNSVQSPSISSVYGLSVVVNDRIREYVAIKAGSLKDGIARNLVSAGINFDNTMELSNFNI
jgi:hypothetical protein